MLIAFSSCSDVALNLIFEYREVIAKSPTQAIEHKQSLKSGSDIRAGS